MKSRQALRAILGVLLCGAGLWLALPSPYRERTYIFQAEGCRLETTIVEKQTRAGQGAVLLFHGISANKKVMSFMARGFAEQGLRVFVPDLPGHGRTSGPFSPARAEQCGEALLHELVLRGLASADRTIIAGHSMGGAIAERIAGRVPVAGLIAISPAPMRAAHGVTEEKLLFRDPPDPPKNSLLIVGALELRGMRENAADLAQRRNDGSTKYEEIPGVSHVSILFNSAAIRTEQEWAAKVLHLHPSSGLPSYRSLLGSMAGFFGILCLAGPFLRETVGKREDSGEDSPRTRVGALWLLATVAVASATIVLLLRSAAPLKAVRLFQGDYLASMFLFLGALLALTFWKSVRGALFNSPRRWLAAAFAGLVLLFLSTAWFDLTFYEAWLTAAKCVRFPLLFLAVLPYHLVEETLLGPLEPGRRGRRLVLALSLRVIIWAAMLGGIFFLHSGMILVGLLGGYFAIFQIVQRSGMDIVRRESGSAAASAVFGAILLAGFCLVIFPLT